MQALVLLIGLAFKDEDGLSVCEWLDRLGDQVTCVSEADLVTALTVPLTPVEILWVIMCTSSFPAMGLGAEKADPDVVRPHARALLSRERKLTRALP